MGFTEDVKRAELRLLKKGGKTAREEKQAASPSKSGPSDDPYDFSTLDADIATAVERLKNDLSKLRAGGRFNPEVLENLRVQPDKRSNQTVKLNDLAQVVPKGRTVQILVGEQEHVKPISTAIQSSSLSLTPQPDPTGMNPLLLVLNIPPPTAESRKQVVGEATKAGEKASTSVRDARSKQQKKLRGMQLAKSALPDDLKKAGTQMEKVVEKGTAEVKRVVDSAKKVLESGLPGRRRLGAYLNYNHHQLLAAVAPRTNAMSNTNSHAEPKHTEAQACNVFLVKEEFKGCDNLSGQRMIGIFRTLDAANSAASVMVRSIEDVALRHLASPRDGETFQSFEGYRNIDAWRNDQGGMMWLIKYGSRLAAPTS
ncbi:uncharacterized protein LTR77_003794 [Saxophila tyrrhenica]|uniref:Ribosome recycling factor domain-containing protein n=1 Tax=Saxophila tyrrhenica TaxID=1690608 RepID=A0AAV9PI16_9PEZI|nr:hypothetical protein LTR77_003794 [Saxophila tyrrhenica]